MYKKFLTFFAYLNVRFHLCGFEARKKLQFYFFYKNKKLSDAKNMLKKELLVEIKCVCLSSVYFLFKGNSSLKVKIKIRKLFSNFKLNK